MHDQGTWSKELDGRPILQTVLPHEMSCQRCEGMGCVVVDEALLCASCFLFTARARPPKPRRKAR